MNEDLGIQVAKLLNDLSSGEPSLSASMLQPDPS